MKIDKVKIHSERVVCDINRSDPERDDRCAIHLYLEITISDSERKDIHDLLMSHFRGEAEGLVLEIREFVDKNKL